jgi:hypothetical protein
MRVIWTSWAHVWRLRSLFLGTGYDKTILLHVSVKLLWCILCEIVEQLGEGIH